MKDILTIGGRDFTSRLFVGTGKFASNELMLQSILASGSEMITVAMKRIDMQNEEEDDMLRHINREHVQFLPNTSGVRDAKEAVMAAHLARECFGTDFIKLEIHPDPKYLLPDPIETLIATEQLAKDGFHVLPYIQADPVLCKRLEEVGSACRNASRRTYRHQQRSEDPRSSGDHHSRKPRPGCDRCRTWSTVTCR